jgi:hypothetical protein
MTCAVYRLDTGQPFIERATLITNSDGSVSFQLDDLNFAGQAPWIVGQPSQYGVRYADGPVCGAYQRASLFGNCVTFLTRPQDNPCAYLVAQGQSF